MQPIKKIYIYISRNLSKIVSVLLSASVKRVFVSLMRDFFYKVFNIPEYMLKSLVNNCNYRYCSKGHYSVKSLLHSTTKPVRSKFSPNFISSWDPFSTLQSKLGPFSKYYAWWLLGYPFQNRSLFNNFGLNWRF